MRNKCVLCEHLTEMLVIMIISKNKDVLLVLLVKIKSCEVLIFANRKFFSNGHISTRRQGNSPVSKNTIHQP